MAEAQSETALRQAEGWRRVAVADAKAWKARAVAAEADRDRYLDALIEALEWVPEPENTKLRAALDQKHRESEDQ